VRPGWEQQTGIHGVHAQHLRGLPIHRCRPAAVVGHGKAQKLRCVQPDAAGNAVGGELHVSQHILLALRRLRHERRGVLAKHLQIVKEIFPGRGKGQRNFIARRLAVAKVDQKIMLPQIPGMRGHAQMQILLDALGPHGDFRSSHTALGEGLQARAERRFGSESLQWGGLVQAQIAKAQIGDLVARLGEREPHRRARLRDGEPPVFIACAARAVGLEGKGLGSALRLPRRERRSRLVQHRALQHRLLLVDGGKHFIVRPRQIAAVGIAKGQGVFLLFFQERITAFRLGQQHIAVTQRQIFPHVPLRQLVFCGLQHIRHHSAVKAAVLVVGGNVDVQLLPKLRNIRVGKAEIIARAVQPQQHGGVVWQGRGALRIGFVAEEFLVRQLTDALLQTLRQAAVRSAGGDKFRGIIEMRGGILERGVQHDADAKKTEDGGAHAQGLRGLAVFPPSLQQKQQEQAQRKGDERIAEGKGSGEYHRRANPRAAQLPPRDAQQGGEHRHKNVGHQQGIAPNPAVRGVRKAVEHPTRKGREQKPGQQQQTDLEVGPLALLGKQQNNARERECGEAEIAPSPRRLHGKERREHLDVILRAVKGNPLRPTQIHLHAVGGQHGAKIWPKQKGGKQNPNGKRPAKAQQAAEKLPRTLRLIEREKANRQIQQQQQAHHIEKIKIAHGGKKHNTDKGKGAFLLKDFFNAEQQPGEVNHRGDKIGMPRRADERIAAKHINQRPAKRGKTPVPQLAAKHRKADAGQKQPHKNQRVIKRFRMLRRHKDGEQIQRVAQNIVVQGGEDIRPQTDAEIPHGDGKPPRGKKVPRNPPQIFPQIHQRGEVLEIAVGLPNQ